MFIVIILDLQQKTLTIIFLMLEPIMANLISVFKVHLSGIISIIM